MSVVNSRGKLLIGSSRSVRGPVTIHSRPTCRLCGTTLSYKRMLTNKHSICWSCSPEHEWQQQLNAKVRWNGRTFTDLTQWEFDLDRDTKTSRLGAIWRWVVEITEKYDSGFKLVVNNSGCQVLPVEKTSSEVPSHNEYYDRVFVPREEEGTMDVADYTPDTINKKVWISDSAWADMKRIVTLCPVEVSWFGVIETLEDGICVTEVHMPEQKVNGVGTEWDTSSFAKMVMKLERERGIEGDQIRFWGHSHVNMQAIFSGHDRQKMSEFGGGGGENDPDWFLNLVMNKQFRYQCILEIFKPTRLSVDVKPTFGHPAMVTKNWATEIRSKCVLGNVRHTSSQAHHAGTLVKGS